MAALTTAQEYAVVREAIQVLSADSQAIYSFNLGDLQVTYRANQMRDLQEREEVLAKRLAKKNARKRVTPDFSAASPTSWRVPEV